MKHNNMNTEKQSSTAPKGGGRKLRNDIIFISALLTIAIMAGLGFYYLRPDGDAVIVTVDGEVYGRFLLSEDVTVDIYTGENDEQHNRLVIKDGEAYVEQATCPDGICAGHRPIHRQGQSIVCLPHRVAITVEKTEKGEQPDIVA